MAVIEAIEFMHQPFRVDPDAMAVDTDEYAFSDHQQIWEKQTEGQITKLKLVKRQMYGRAKLDLLRARVMAARNAVRSCTESA